MAYTGFPEFAKDFQKTLAERGRRSSFRCLENL